MLNEFMKVAYEHTTREAREQETLHLLKQLPKEELFKIATGEIKVADLCNGPDVPKMAGEDEWLEKFKGTPLFDQAVGLLQEELQVDMQELTERQTERAEQAQKTHGYDLKDQIRVKKRLLELQLAQQELGGAGGAPPPDPAAAPIPDAGQQGAGGLGPESAPVAGGPKTASARSLELVAFADRMGRELAHAEVEKVAGRRALEETGAKAGQALAKLGFDWAGMGQKALGVAKAHPMAALGAGLGAVKGLQKDQMGQRHLGGAVTGAATGALAGEGAAHLAPGLADKATGMAGQMAPHLKALGAKMRGALGATPPAV
jgi:hypothetical protein